MKRGQRVRARAKRREAIGWQEADKLAAKLFDAQQFGRVPHAALTAIAAQHRVTVTWLRQFAGARSIKTQRREGQ